MNNEENTSGVAKNDISFSSLETTPFFKNDDIESANKVSSQTWYPKKKTHLKYKGLSPVSVFDVAKYILAQKGQMTTMKLQKLVYYCQAWSLVWDESPLFEEEIQAWSNGPVIPKLYYYHRGNYYISDLSLGNPEVLNDNQKDTIDEVLEFYGKQSAQWLIDLSHMEEPWKMARKGMNNMERGNKKIALDSIAEYYSSLQNNDQEEES